MDNVVDLLEYKKKKEENEIEALRKELADLISEMGGIHMVPMMIQSSCYTDCSTPLYTPFEPAGVSFSYDYYLQEHDYDGNKE